MMKKIYLVILMAVLPLLSQAQALKGSYFLDNSLNRHELNPAFAPRANYVQLLGVGNTGGNMGSNFQLSDFVYPSNGELLTFLHPSISVEQFDKNLPKYPHVDFEAKTTLFGFGFYTKKKSFWTFDLDFYANVDNDLPRDLFMFLKKGTGTEGNVFNVGNMNMYASTGLQASLGYSRQIFDGLRVGAKARFVVPFFYYALNSEKMQIDASPQKWTLTSEAYLHMAQNGVDLSFSDDLMPDADFDLQRFLANGVVTGIGYSFDLGVEYVLEKGTLFDGLSVSAAVTDLGRVKYDENSVSSFKMAGSMEWEGFSDLDVETTFDNFLEEIEGELLNLEEMPHPGKFTRSTMPRVHVGVEMPFLKRSMSVGLLYSARMSHSYPRNELTVSYNLTPCKWFAMGINYSFLETTKTFGFVMELTPRVGPAFYLGFDYLPYEFTSLEIGDQLQMMPTATRVGLNFGLALHLGGKTTKAVKAKKSDNNKNKNNKNNKSKKK